MRKRLLLSGLIGLLVAIPAAVYASHQFNDVSSSNTFHADIGWLADNGITKGCNPPANSEFCPDDPVSRGQMAAFMKRFHDRFLLGSGSETIGLGFSWRSSSEPPSTGNGFVSGLSMTVNVPEQGVLLVNASAETFSDVIDAFGCGISTDGSPGTASAASWRTVDLTANFYDTCSTQTALAVNPGTRHIGLVISGAEPDTQVTSAAVTAVLLTNSGSFGLLSEPQADIEAPDIIDEKKGE